MARPSKRKEITDVRVIGALAHPVRVQLLGYLLLNGARTATECSVVVDATPSACSYHLRHLERFGLVERADDAGGDEVGNRQPDGRERRWRTTATGFSFGGRPSEDGRAMAAARHAQVAASIDEGVRLARRFLTVADTLSAEWQDAVTFSTYGLLISPSELEQLTASIDALVRPFIGITRDDAPADAAPVHIGLHAFRRLEP
jgi:hypothetical protein